MESIILVFGIAIFGGWIISILMITILSLIMYPFDKKIYTHPKWHTIFPYHFKIEYKVKQPSGQNIVYTTIPSMWGFPFLGEEKFRMKREFFTKEYMESDEFKKMKESVDYIMKNQKKRKK
jgi:hypothetical protein